LGTPALCKTRGFLNQRCKRFKNQQLGKQQGDFMKKLLVGMAALSIGAAAQADVKFSGDTLISYANVGNAQGVKDSNSEGWTLWNNLYVDGNKGENLSYRLQLRHVVDMGARAGVTPSAGTDATSDGHLDATNSNDLVFVQEAVGYAKVGDNGTISFGRSGLELNSGELISKRSFDNSMVAFDGIRYVHDAEWGRLGLSYSVSAKSGTNRIKFRGLSYTFKNTPEAISNLELHYVNAHADGSTLASVSGINGNNSRTWIGLNAKGEMGMADYRLNVENFTGKTNPSTDAKATMIDLELGYRMSFKDSRISLGYHTDGTTDDGFYDGLYYDNHKYAGLMDVVGWGNLQDISLGYTMKDGNCDFGFAFHQFARVKGDKEITNASGSKLVTTGNEDTAIGSEIDVWYKHTYDSGLFVYAELGQFSAGDAYKAITTSGYGDENITRLYVETGFDF
jgi:hypothetical protein